jgi:hypothetical protein
MPLTGPARTRKLSELEGLGKTVSPAGARRAPAEAAARSRVTVPRRRATSSDSNRVVTVTAASVTVTVPGRPPAAGLQRVVRRRRRRRRGRRIRTNRCTARDGDRRPGAGARHVDTSRALPSESRSAIMHWQSLQVTTHCLCSESRIQREYRDRTT